MEKLSNINTAEVSAYTDFLTKPIRDSKKRSWVKSIVWRVIGVFLLGGLAWIFTGDWQDTTVITITFHLIRVIMYYYHERAWEKIGWGRNEIHRQS
jgi:uncharacterized membrane protein